MANNAFKIAGSIVLNTGEAMKGLKDIKKGTDDIKKSVDGKGSLSDKFKKMGKTIQETGKKMQEVGGKVKDIGGGITKGLTVPLVAASGGAIAAAKSFEDASIIIEDGLGVAGKEAENLTEIANSIYKKGFAESLGDTSHALVNVKQNMGDLVKDSELEEVTQNAMLLAEVMDEDVGWVTRATSTMMKQFGTTSEEAFDLMTWGIQNGLNYSDELADNIAEYGPLMASMGYSAEEYFAMMANGAKEGAYNMDFVNDVVKEFDITIKEGSDATLEAIAGLSKETQGIFKEFQNGKATVKDVMQAVSGDLSEMDELTANAIGVELFKTKWEDMGADAVIALADINSNLKGVDGSMKAISDGAEETFGAQLQSLIRETADALRPVGEILVGLARDYLPPLIDGIRKAAEWFEAIGPAGQKAVIFIGALVAGIGPLITVVGTLIGAMGALAAANWAVLGPALLIVGAIMAIIAAIVAFIFWGDEIVAFIKKAVIAVVDRLKEGWEAIKELWGMFTEWFGEAWNSFVEWLKEAGKKLLEVAIFIFKAIFDPIGLLWELFGDDIKRIWGDIQDWLSQKWDSFKDWAANLWQSIVDGLVAIVDWFVGRLMDNWNTFKNIMSNNWNTFKNFAITIWSAITGGISKVWDVLTGTLSNIWDSMKSNFTNNMNSVKNTAATIWETVKDIFKKGINFIKGLFNFEFKWPKLKLPRFSVSGGFSLNPPSVPKIGVEWFAKGGIMNAATVFGMNGNNLMVGGEAGPEAILPLNPQTLGAIGNGIAREMNANRNNKGQDNNETNQLLKMLIGVIVDKDFEAVLNINDREFARATAGAMDRELENRRRNNEKRW